MLLSGITKTLVDGEDLPYTASNTVGVSYTHSRVLCFIVYQT